MASFNRRTYDAADSTQYTVDTADGTLTYVLEADEDDPEEPSLSEIEEKKIELLGYTKLAPALPPGEGEIDARGRLDRVLPLAHPEDPAIFCSNVTVSRVEDTRGFMEEDANPADFLEAPPLQPAILWDSYVFNLRFAPRPYAVISNAAIPFGAGFWHDDEGDHVPYEYVEEWRRFTDFDYAPREDILKARFGAMKYRIGSDPDYNLPYPQLASMPLPNGTMSITWYGVPFRYITSMNSYLMRFRYRVNQLSFLEFSPGEILYKGFRVLRRYTSFPEFDAEILGSFSNAKTCDLVIECLITKREGVDLPDYTLTGNQNFVVGGWNLLPKFDDRKFYYVSTVPTDPIVDEPHNQYPSFLSFPFPLLFWDPDIPNPRPAPP